MARKTKAVKAPPEGETFSDSVGVLVERVFSRGRTENDVFDPANFKQVKNSWWLDRALPGGVGAYFLAAGIICTAVWLLGLLARLIAVGFENIGHNTWRFVLERQWQLQPLLLFVHFLSLRLFKGIYSRNFDRAFVHLDVTPDELVAVKRWFLGARVNFFALAIAAPFVAWDAIVVFRSQDFYQRLFGDTQYLELIDHTVRNGEAWLMLAIWSFEWWMFGYYCYLVLAGAFVVRSMLKRHDFKEAVDLVLTERQYRPLFNVTAQAGSVVFVYGLILAGYMFYTRGMGSDYFGLGLLVVLLALSFGVTWSSVRFALRAKVEEATKSLEQSYRAARTALGSITDVPGIEDDLLRIQVQLKMSLALQQSDYLQSKYEKLGRREFLGLTVRMIAPVGTVLARVIRWGSLIAALGLGGAALGLGGDKEEPASNAPASNAP